MRLYFSIPLIVLPFILLSCGPGTQYDRNLLQGFLANEDPFAPELVLNGRNPMNVEAATAFQDPGARAASLKEGDLTSLIQVSGSVDSFRLGESILTYRLPLSSGAFLSAQRRVNVSDTIPPTVSLIGNEYISFERCESECEEFIDPGINVLDSFDSSPVIEKTGTVNLEVTGEYQLTYRARDSSGNQSEELIRTVSVQDTIRPDPVVLSFDRSSPSSDDSNLNVMITATADVRFVQVIRRSSPTQPTPSLDCRDVDFGFMEYPISGTLSLDFAVVPNQWNYFCARGRDASANDQAVNSYSDLLLIDTTVPESVLISSLGSSPSNDASARVVSISNPSPDAIGVFEGAIDYQAILRQSVNAISNPVAFCSGTDFRDLGDVWMPLSQSFTANVSAGYNIVCARGRDRAGNIQAAVSASNVLFVDLMGPSLTISRPIESFLINQSSGTGLVVDGTCSENDRPVNLTGSFSPRSVNCSSGHFSDEIDFSSTADGPIQILASHQDQAGNSTSAQVSGLKDTTPPVMTLLGDNPLSRQLCEEINDPGAQSVDAISGSRNVQLISSSVQEQRKGTYALVYESFDQAGNRAEIQRLVEYSLTDSVTDFDYALKFPSDWPITGSDLGANLTLCDSLAFNGTNTNVDVSGPLSGVFDARGFELSGFVIQNFSSSTQALFSEITATGQVLNLNVRDAQTFGRNDLAIIAAKNQGRLQNVHVYDSSVQENSSATARRAGALVGENSGVITQSSSVGNQISSNEDVGGLVGRNSGIISDSISRANQVSGNDDVGGLVGRLTGASGLIERSYSASTVIGDSLEKGGLVGENDAGSNSVLMSYYDLEVSGKTGDNLDESQFGSPRTTLQMQDSATYVDWDFSLIWEWIIGNYPRLR